MGVNRLHAERIGWFAIVDRVDCDALCGSKNGVEVRLMSCVLSGLLNSSMDGSGLYRSQAPSLRSTCCSVLGWLI